MLGTQLGPVIRTCEPALPTLFVGHETSDDFDSAELYQHAVRSTTQVWRNRGYRPTFLTTFVNAGDSVPPKQLNEYGYFGVATGQERVVARFG
jgi:hypothetical protein